MTNAPPPPNWNADASALLAPLGPPAGFWIRVIATLIDWVIVVFLASLLVGVIAGAVFASGESAAGEIVAGIGIFIGIFGLIALSWLCEAIMTSSPRGATFGKRAVLRYAGHQGELMTDCRYSRDQERLRRPR